MRETQTSCVPEKPQCSSRAAAAAAESHNVGAPSSQAASHHIKAERGNLGQIYRHHKTNVPTNGEQRGSDSCVFRVRRTTASLPSHIQHKYFSQAVETIAEMLKLVTSHCALIDGRLESCVALLASSKWLSRYTGETVCVPDRC